MVVLRAAAVADRYGCFGVYRAGELGIPVELAARVRHAVVDVARAGDPLGDVSRVRRDLGGDDALLDVVDIGKRQVLGRRHVAKESRAVHGSHSAADRGSDVVVAGRDVCDKGPQNIEGRAHADGLLHLHICCDLVQRHVSGSFDHDLNVVGPCSFGELAEADQFFDLAHICRVCKTARSAGVSEGDRHIVFLADLQDLVIVLIERIFISRHAHPGKDKTSAAADDIHLSLVPADLFDGLAGDAAVQCHEIHAVLRVEANYVDEILRCQCRQVSLIVDHAVVDRHGSDHDGTFVGQLLAEGLRISVAGQVHDRLCAHIYGAHHLLHLDVVVLAVSGYAQVNVDLGAQHTSDAFR